MDGIRVKDPQNNDRGMAGKTEFSFPVRMSEYVLELSYMLEIHNLQGF